jgi:hypothetical protein
MHGHSSGRFRYYNGFSQQFGEAESFLCPSAMLSGTVNIMYSKQEEAT